ncbi:ensconsin-like isoform X6 [Sitophilus oryzae]|uniref:Ensconsin-like isoform X6 n=1 Tax=Sitophilus oryzae TaxID=7048 RepID=A0A6J2X5L9_SITOR|nr:ensconsin-like isoform X6 [Sitophilus oryzae]
MSPGYMHNDNFSEHINCIRSILVKTLSSENVSKSDVLKVKRFDKNYGNNKTTVKHVVDKEARLRGLKERQNEERQKKLEELRAQALAAQRFKEQKEFERRRRLEDMRVKDDQRRHLVEERKKAINEAERDRLESILRRNQERDARIEAKKRNERSSIVFAFGSSTPRMLDPTDVTVSFWGHRRATSTQNITISSSGSSLTRRQSERDLDASSKKRATSAGGLERAAEGLISPTTPAGCASGYIGRRRTDLVPTIPSRDSSFHSSTSRKSLNHSPASSRPSSAMSQQSTNSVTSSVNVRHRLSTTPRRPRPASIAITGVTHDKNSIDKGEHKPPLPKTRKPLSKTNTSEKIEKTKTKPAKSPAEESAPKITAEQKKEDKTEKKQEVGPQKVQPLPQRVEASPPEKELDVSQVQTKEPSPPPLIATQDIEAPKSQVIESTAQHQEDRKVTTTEQLSPQQDNIIQNFIDSERKAAEQIVGVQKTDENSAIVSNNEKHEEKDETKDVKQDNSDTISSEMTTSISKPRITTEEEAKAALAERRRLIREEAERQAELERQRIEAEQKAEFERQQREEEQARLLAEMQRQSEQERLQEAIREAQRREEEERLRREEEARQKILKEEADKKAKEEAERQKAELQKKLENEEKEREERRKRVEMIMSRTRGKNNANLPSQNSQDKTKPENKQVTEEDKLNEDNKVNENKLNGSQQENGTNDTSTKNGKDMGIVDNIIPDDSLKNANTTVTDTLNSDSINSNSAWQPTQQYGNLLYNNNS